MKRLLVFFDGTWNKPDGRAEITNVVKLSRLVPAVAPDGTPQITRYIEGIGTDTGDSENEAFWEGAIGVGIGQRICAGYRFIAENYAPGDEIYLFGFSRGAFQARSLSGLLTMVGLLQRQSLDRLEDAWAYYQSHRHSPDPARLASIRALGHPDVRIRCLGVWDTVGNLGVPIVGAHGVGADVSFHHTELSPLVEVGLHALALDEPRGTFSPTLWTKARGATLPAGQLIEQVWFPGAHANVGGGYEDAALSDIALIWMAERAATASGIVFDMERLHAEVKPDPLGLQVSPTSDGIYRATPLLPFVRLINQDTRGLAPLRRLLLPRFRNNRLDDGLETVNESLHPSLAQRFGRRVPQLNGERNETITYHPRALRVALKATRAS